MATPQEEYRDRLIKIEQAQPTTGVGNEAASNWRGVLRAGARKKLNRAMRGKQTLRERQEAAAMWHDSAMRFRAERARRVSERPPARWGYGD